MSARRRALLVLAAALLLAVLSWLAAAVIGNTRVSLGTGDDALAVSTDLPLATCSKAFTREFPWVRFGCEPREGDGGPRSEGPSSAGSPALDTTGAGE